MTALYSGAMTESTTPADAEKLQELFVEVTGDEEVTEEQEGTDRREASDEFDEIAGRSEQEGIADTIETPDESL
jgi:hypothetical protein